MKVDLNFDELTMLIQLVNQRMVQQGREHHQRGTPMEELALTTRLEVALMTKLYEAHIDEMDVIDPSHDHRTGLPLKTTLEP